MNKREINEWRVAHGLSALPDTGKSGKCKRTLANRQARAQECRDLKSKRNKGGK